VERSTCLRIALLAVLSLAPVGNGALYGAEPEADPSQEQNQEQKQDPQRSSTPEKEGGLPEGTLEFGGAQSIEADGTIILEGPVTFRSKSHGMQFQADRMEFLNENYFKADGNVLVIWGTNRISGSRMEYWIEEDRGIIHDAFGQMEGDFYFTARTAEKVGEDTVYLKDAMVSTCTQPVPYWSFRMSSAKLKLDGYARLWNVRLKVGKVSVFYLPTLLWPVKEGRSAGLLIPEVHSTRNRGRAIALPMFIPLGRSADMTVIGRYFSEGGPGAGLIFNSIPNRNGSIQFVGDYIDDEVADANRYNLAYKQTQKFLNGFRMVADVNAVSDFNYFNDFERDLNLTSSPSILARVDFARTGKRVSMNVREFRREQLFSDGSSLIQQTLPEIELRGRSQQLGKLPLYLSYETSVVSIQQSGTQQGIPIDADYLRADFFPVISAPISPVAWLDITPKISYRWTWYSQSQFESVDLSGSASREILDTNLTRGVGAAGIVLTGPKFYRIYDRPNSNYSKRYKHSIEPNLSYAFQEGFDDREDIIVFDEVDRFGAAGNSVAYGIRSRLFAQRPRSTRGVSTGPDYSILMPNQPAGGAPLPGEAPGVDPFDLSDEEPSGEEQPLETLEIASLEIRQARSFDTDLSFADLDGDGVLEENSRYSSLSLIGRVNPKPRLSFDLRSSWHPLYREIQDVSLSGSVMNKTARVTFSLVHRAGLGVTSSTDPTPVSDDTQLQMSAGLNLFGGKLRLGLSGTYDADPALGQERFPAKQWRVQYSTQCCTYYLESLERGFTGDQTRDDFFFRIDLRGIGKVLDQRF
jgi:lipopolysaccharide assembly outer membrane protein LptD (OstA)